MSWDTAVADVRTILSDGAIDKLRWSKKIMGPQNGSNLIFKTFEDRRLSTFVGATGAPTGVFKNDVIAVVTAEDLTTGQFTLQTAPANGDTIRATYYLQWFTDDEVQQFLKTATEWIQSSDDYTQLPQALWPAAKYYASACAYQKLVLKFSTNLAETYQLFDAPEKGRFDPVATYAKIAKDLFKQATDLRDDVYGGRKGQAKAPIGRAIRGRVKDVPPNR